jgi:hypothetical protein
MTVSPIPQKRIGLSYWMHEVLEQSEKAVPARFTICVPPSAAAAQWLMALWFSTAIRNGKK